MIPNLTVADVLERAADILTPEGAWTQGDAARDAEGRALDKGSTPEAVCWCVLGAIDKVVGSAATLDFKFAMQALEGALPKHVEILCGGDGEELPLAASWNDAEGRTQAEVVAKLREAAVKARAS